MLVWDGRATVTVGSGPGARVIALALAAPDSLGCGGVRVTRGGRADLTGHIAPDGRVAHVRTVVPDAVTGERHGQDLWLASGVASAGIRWPRVLRVTVDPEALPAPVPAVTPGGPAQR